jgi:hypothetical protein
MSVPEGTCGIGGDPGGGGERELSILVVIIIIATL